MIFDIFRTGRASRSGVHCTEEYFWDIANNPSTEAIVAEVRRLVDANVPDLKEKTGALKKKLPVICWQASYKENHRQAQKAIPSGLFMLDIDGCGKEKMEEYIAQAQSRREELQIVYIGETPKYGVRIVARCFEQFTDIPQCQQYLYDTLDVPAESRDKSCVDWARGSYAVPASLVRYLDPNIFDPDTTCVTYENKTPQGIKVRMPKSGETAEATMSSSDSCQTEYQGLPIREIVAEWYRQHGGEPVEGNRNTSIFQAATDFRYITDFNQAVLLRCLDSYGLSEEEMRAIIHSAVSQPRSGKIPNSLLQAIDTLRRTRELEKSVGGSIDLTDINDTSRVPSLPPIFKEWYDVAPADFKVPSVIVQLPILGALGSKLRADNHGEMQHPSFQVSLEAPQASGKSFMKKLATKDLELMIAHDEAEREKELEYKDKVERVRLSSHMSKQEVDKALGEKPKPLIRYCPATISVTQLLIRMQNARGLHLFTMAEEIDTLNNSLKKSFSPHSDMLRNAFDDTEFGQDYASDNSFSGIVKLHYNILLSGTPKAMRRFYPNVEDGLVSRVFFCTLPDQFGRPRPIWREFTPEQQQSLDLALTRLNSVTIQGEEVQPDHVMQMGWLVEEMDQWVVAQQKVAVQTGDRTRDTFCRRAAIVGFRAGMLAWFLWEESPRRKRSVKAFSRWIANLMLKQHLTRFDITEDVKNTIPFPDLYQSLPDTFNRFDLEKERALHGISTDVRRIIFRWTSAGIININPQSQNIITKTRNL